MAAICAGCMKPIGSKEKFVLASSEVFHKTCIPLIPQSRLWKMKQEMLRMRGVLDEERAQGARARIEVQDLEREVRNMRSARDQARDEVTRISRDAARASHEVQSANDRANEMSRRAQRLGSERDAAIARAEAAERELALHRALGPVTQPAEGSGTPEADDRDATEIRFSLLEPHEP